MTGLRNLLEEAADGAKVYDVTDRALAVNRRRRVRRAGLAAGAVAAGIIAIGVTVSQVAPAALDPPPSMQPNGSPAQGSPVPQACDIARLPLPAGNWVGSDVRAGDLTGRFLAGLVHGHDRLDRTTVLWDNGQVRATLPTHGIEPDIVAVNSRGDIVETSSAGVVAQSFVYHGGGWTKLKGHDARAVAMNDKGVIVGRLEPDNVVITPVIWRSFTAEPQRLEVPDGWFADAWGIDDAGNIVGMGRPKPIRSMEYAMIWSPDGKVRQLTIPASPSQDRLVKLISLHSGQATFSFIGGPRAMTEYWRVDLTTGDAAKLDLPYSAQHIAANGWVLRSYTGTLVAGDTVVTLPDLPDHVRTSDAPLLPPRSPGGSPYPVVSREPRTSARFSVMSVDGRIIAGSETASIPDTPVAVIWRCR